MLKLPRKRRKRYDDCKEVSRLTGVSVRPLQYYDQIGLLHPGTRTEAGYRLYDATPWRPYSRFCCSVS